MTPRHSVRRTLLVPVLAALLSAGLAFGAGQENDSDTENKESQQETTSESADKADKTDSEETNESTASKDPDAPGTTPAAAAAGMLQSKGTLISQTGDLDISVEQNVFHEFPGVELGHLTTPQRDALIKRANTVYCTCGCRGDTVARCVIMDPSCQVARKMLQKMLEAIAPADKSEANADND